MTAAAELRQLADRLDHAADWLASHDRDTPEAFVPDLRAAAVALRHHANLTDAIGHPTPLVALRTIGYTDQQILDTAAKPSPPYDGPFLHACRQAAAELAAAVSPPPAPTTCPTCPTCGSDGAPGACGLDMPWLCTDPWHQQAT